MLLALLMLNLIINWPTNFDGKTALVFTNIGLTLSMIPLLLAEK